MPCVVDRVARCYQSTGMSVPVSHMAGWGSSSIIKRWVPVQSASSLPHLIYFLSPLLPRRLQWRAFIIVRQFRPAVYACALRAAQQSGSPEPHWSQGKRVHFRSTATVWELVVVLVRDGGSAVCACALRAAQQSGSTVPHWSQGERVHFRSTATVWELMVSSVRDGRSALCACALRAAQQSGSPHRHWLQGERVHLSHGRTRLGTASCQGTGGCC